MFVRSMASRRSVILVRPYQGCIKTRSSVVDEPAADPMLEREVAPPPSRLRITSRPDFAVVATPSGVVVPEDGPAFVPWLVSPSGSHAVAGDELVAFRAE